MNVTLAIDEIKQLLDAAASQAVAAFVAESDPAADLISQRQAFRLFKESRVRRWLEQGLIHTQRLGETSRSKRAYSRRELMALDASERIDPLLNRPQPRAASRLCYGFP